ncbi:MAG: MBL fold metallo-hydrolase [Chloroflexota bacterium]
MRGIVVGVFQANCYIVGSPRTSEAICIDPGDEPSEILALARDMGVTIEKIVCTHAHLDHVMAVNELQAQTGAVFLLHGADHAIAQGVPSAALALLGRTVAPVPAPGRTLSDGDSVEIHGVDLRVIHTPGHTPGSISLYGHGMLFSGDTLFYQSIGRTDLPGGDTETILGSISNRLFALPDETVVLPGHMRQTTIGHERANNPFTGGRDRT